MTQNQTCPNPRMFRELLDGLLSESDQTQLATHLDTCEQCRLKLDELTGELPVPPQVAQHPDQGSEPTETALFDVIKNMGNELPFDDQTRIEQPDESDFSIDFLEPSQQPDSMGRLGGYEISEVIGRGGMGIVLKGYDGKLQRVVAVKVLAPELASNPTARKRFLREARAAAAVNHPHVVTIHAVEETERLPFLVMELVDGQSLEQKIYDEGHLEIKEILRIGMQVAEGLSAAHKQGLIHRDIKPLNILLENGIERVKITDFGLARAVDDIRITRTGEVAGTPQYMSPEQAESEPVDQRSDLFSLGSVLYAMCTGRSPFRADNMLAVLRRVCDDTPRPIREINPDIPAWLTEIIDKLLAKKPTDRFQTGKEVSDLLSQHLADIQHPNPDPRRAVGVSPLMNEPKNHPKNQGVDTPRSPLRRLKTIALILVLLGTGVSFTEATGVTKFTATVIRIVTGEGTLLIEVDDPSVTVSIDGDQISISGAGVQELKLRPGQYKFRASKNGQPVKEELVTITRGGRKVVSVHLEGSPAKVTSIEAARDFSLALSLVPEGRDRIKQRWRILNQLLQSAEVFQRVVELRPDDIGLWDNRGRYLARRGRYEEAAACFQKRLALGPAGARTWLEHAIALLGNDDRIGYRKLCEEMLETFSETPIPDEARSAAWAMAVTPDSVEDNNKAFQLAKRAFSAVPEDLRTKITYALWLYRTDRLEEAVSLFNELTKTNQKNFSHHGYVWIFAAMAHHRLGNAEEAHKWADMGNDWCAKSLAPIERSNPGMVFKRVLPKVLTKEMQQVLSNKPDQTGVSKPENNQPASAPKPEVGKQKSEVRNQKSE